MASSVAVVILAAGQGKRMHSEVHKVLHRVAGRPMIDYVLETARALSPEKIVVVVGDKRDQLEAHLPEDVVTVCQEPQRGTGHAVQVAMQALADFAGDVLILYGDVPFVPAQTLSAVIAERQKYADVMPIVLIGFNANDPTGFGRLITNDEGVLQRIAEEKDATEAERKITACNSGVMVIDGGKLPGWLSKLAADNEAGEYYLTDIIGIAREEGGFSAVLMADEQHMLGVNTRLDLAKAEALFQSANRRALLLAGVTMTAPETVFFSHDTKLSSDVVIEPHVVFGPGVVIEAGVTIKSFSHLEGARVKSGAVIGPYARLRPGADIGHGAKVGNFVEIKKARVGALSKISHLSYIGDATLGDAVNIGAGTITCNYDGFTKAETVIGNDAFIGSNTALVAPVSVGAGSVVGAGSTITANVSADALALTRADQVEKKGYSAAKRLQQISEEEDDATPGGDG